MKEVIGKRIRNITNNDIIYSKYIYCDFRTCHFKEIDLDAVEFVGCHFGNSTFTNVKLGNTKFIGCFISGYDLPIEIINTNISKIIVKYSNISFQESGNIKRTFQYWNDQIVKIISDGQNLKNEDRILIFRKEFDKVKNDYESYFYLILMVIMLDSEWDMYYGIMSYISNLPEEKISVEKENTWKFFYSFLTSEYGLIRTAINDIIEEKLPEYNQLQMAIDKIYSDNDDILLNALSGLERIAWIDKYKNEIDKERIKFLIMKSNKKQIILQCFEIIKRLKDEYFIQVILDFIKNTDDEDICGAGLQTLSYLDYLPDLDEYIMYLEHDSPKVRSEALWLAYYADDITIEKVKSIIESDNTGVLKTTYENIQEFDKQSS